MLTRILVAAMLAGLSLGFAPMPFPRPKKKGAPTPEELAARFQGTWKVTSYEMGGRAGLGRAIAYTEVQIKDGTWTQVRDIGGRKITQQYQLKLDTTKPVPEMSLGYAGGRDATFVGFMAVSGDQQVTVTYAQRGRPAADPFGALGLGHYRWVLEKTGK